MIISYRKKRFILILSILPYLVFSGGRSDRGYRITIAEQYGLAYAPVQIMRIKGFLEKENPLIETSWVKLGNTAAIREAVLAGKVDAGFMGIPPFLIASDKGMTWKICSGLSRSPLGLMVDDEEIQDITDFIERNIRIALPQPGSIQHILLSLFLKREYGDSHLLDNCIVSMNHPDGMAALLSGAVSGHFSSPPYLFHEREQSGYSCLVTGEEAVGEPFSFIVGMVTEEFYRDRNSLYRDYMKALSDSVDFIYARREETVEILSGEYGLEKDVLRDYLYNRGMEYDLSVMGLDIFLNFMEEENLISGNINIGDILLETH